MSERIEIRVPDIGDFTEVPVIEVLVAPGDMVDVDDSLLTLESDKATMEVPSPVRGRITQLQVRVGDEVSEGDVVARIDAEKSGAGTEATGAVDPDPEPGSSHAAQTETETVPRPEPEPRPEPKPTTMVAAPGAGQRQSPPVPMDANATLPGKVPYASPTVRAFARELGVDLFKVTGSERKGRIVRADVTSYVKAVMAGDARPAGGGLTFDLPDAPAIDFSKFGTIEHKALSRIRKISGKNLHRNWLSIPHVTHHDHADITVMEELRQAGKEAAAEAGYKLTPLVFLIKAAVAALHKFPEFNASLDPGGEQLVRKKYYHIGIAVDTADGLVVPVIRNCDEKSLAELARELGDLSQRAREKQLSPRDWQGASFTISSLGGIGGSAFNPIINAPEVAILGVSRSRMEPVWDGQQFVPRLMLPLAVSYDHRVIDGASAARFTRALAEQLENVDSSGLSS
jgi:pyruvate dehydrogenase E2 component (dihydrolipoamide acetyltransferase)